MSTPEDQAPLGAAPADASPPTDEARTDTETPRLEPDGARGDASAEHGGSPDGAPSAASASDALSPAVRRLVRQFDLDITGIHGTGPSGRIRVGDVMGLLGGRTDSGNRDVPLRAAEPEEHAEPAGEAEPREDAGGDLTGAAVAEATPARKAIPTSTVFACDLGRVLAHRKKLRDGDVELLTTSYFLTALATALDAAPEITAGRPPRFGVWLCTPQGEQRSALVDIGTIPGAATLDERVRAVDTALRASLGADITPANLLVHHYGESGSVLATPTPIGNDHAASVGIGRVRREVVVRTVNGAEAPRLASCCYLSLSFFADRVPLGDANRALAEAVRILETWPE